MKPLVTVRPAQRDELSRFSLWESLPGVSEFIAPDPVEQHEADFVDPDSVQLSVLSGKEVVGFVLLVLDADKTSIEFRRIVIAERGRGYGTAAVLALESFCRDELARSRIWLDVFATNSRAIHLYKKVGYQQFKQSQINGRSLLLMEKLLE